MPKKVQIFNCLCDATHCPELDEILEHGGSNEQTVQQWVGQEEDEELVVGKAHTVVHPAKTHMSHITNLEWKNLSLSKFKFQNTAHRIVALVSLVN